MCGSQVVNGWMGIHIYSITLIDSTVRPEGVVPHKEGLFWGVGVGVVVLRGYDQPQKERSQWCSGPFKSCNVAEKKRFTDNKMCAQEDFNVPSHLPLMP